MVWRLIEVVLFLVGLVAVLAALGCAFVTFATNDYGPILAAGFGFVALALSCFAFLSWRRPRERLLYLCAGMLPSLLALWELAYRTVNGLLR
jgi:ABC-type uncharacterized transport system permease subunit